MKGLFYNGSTGVIVRILLLDSGSTTGGGKTGLTSASAGGIVSVIADNEATATAYTVTAGNLETISTLGTYAAPTSGKCRFKEVDATNHPGLYEIHLANARWAVSGAKSIIITVSGFSATVPANAEYQLSAVPATDASGSALPVASDWTSTRAGYLDAAISSRSTYAGGDTSGTTTLLSRLSATRAGYLDNLTNVDATISSRGTAADMATLLSRLSASRAGYLDYLNIGGLVASQADINVLNQSASRRIILTALEQWERPESGSSTFTIEARTWDGDGAATNADATPTLTATGGASGSLAASLSSATNPATGVYRWTFTVSSSATLEQVTLDISATIGGSAFTLTRFAVILDAVSATWTTNDRTKLTAVYDKLPTRQYLCGSTVNSGAIDLADRNAISDTVWDDATSDHTDANTFGALVQSLATSSALATAASNITTILGKLTGITYLKNWLAALAGKTADSGTLSEMQATTAGATYDNTTDSLQGLRDRGDSGAWGGSGGSGLTGANLVTITVTDGTDPVPGAYVRLKAGGDVEVKRTNGSGVVTFTTDNNTWTVTIDATNLTFESTTLAVTGDVEVTYAMDPVTTSTSAWATGDDLVSYYDAKTIGQMLSDDGTVVAASSVPDHAIVTRCLKLATGEVDAALMHCNRYSQAQLEALTDPSLEHLKHITCAVAVWHLQQRRMGTNPERAEAFRKQAQEDLERLRKGEIVLNVDELKLAGLIDHVEYSKNDIINETPRLLRDVATGPAGAFPRRRNQ